MAPKGSTASPRMNPTWAEEPGPPVTEIAGNACSNDGGNVAGAVDAPDARVVGICDDQVAIGIDRT